MSRVIQLLNDRALARRTYALGLTVFLVCLAGYLPTVSSVIVNTDATANSLTAWNIAHTGKPWMEGLDLSETGELVHYGPGRDGHVVTMRTPGQIWAAVPFYLGSSRDQQEWTYTRGGIAAAVLTAGAVTLMFLGLRRQGVALPLALGATWVFAFTTPVWSVSANALWTHPVTLLGLGGAVWSLAGKKWWLVGVWLAVGMTARVHIALIAAVLGLGLAWSRRSPAIAASIAGPTLAALGLVSAWNYYVFGGTDPRGAYSGHALENMVPTVGEGSDGYFLNLAGFLVSPDRGVLIWTPLLLLLLPAVLRGWPSAPDWARWLAAGGVVYSLAQVGINVFHGGDAFYGYRLGLELLATVTPLYVLCAHRAGSLARRLAPLVIGAQAGAMFVGSVQEFLLLPETQVWRDNALLHGLVEYPASLLPVFLIVSVALGLCVRYAIESSSRSVRSRTTVDSADN